MLPITFGNLILPKGAASHSSYHQTKFAELVSLLFPLTIWVSVAILALDYLEEFGNGERSNEYNAGNA
jgi:hypothetical protein